MSLEVIVPLIALIGLLVLVLPGFIQTNYNFKILLKNLSIWIIVVAIILIFIYLIMRLSLINNYLCTPGAPETFVTYSEIRGL